MYAVALDVADGAEIWRVSIEPPSGGEDFVEAPTSTPASDGERVYAIHPAGRLVALRAHDGERLWSRDLGELGAAPPSYGMTTSPVLHDGVLYALVGGTNADLVAFDPKTGAILRKAGGGAGTSYATPVAALVAGERHLIVPGAERVFAVRLGASEVIWSQTGLEFPDRDPLVLADGRVFVRSVWQLASVRVETAP